MALPLSMFLCKRRFIFCHSSSQGSHTRTKSHNRYMLSYPPISKDLMHPWSFPRLSSPFSYINHIIWLLPHFLYQKTVSTLISLLSYLQTLSFKQSPIHSCTLFNYCNDSSVLYPQTQWLPLKTIYWESVDWLLYARLRAALLWSACWIRSAPHFSHPLWTSSHLRMFSSWWKRSMTWQYCML